jgi:hypothetical protein
VDGLILISAVGLACRRDWESTVYVHSFLLYP